MEVNFFAVTGLHDIDEYIQAQLLLAVSKIPKIMIKDIHAIFLDGIEPTMRKILKFILVHLLYQKDLIIC